METDGDDAILHVKAESRHIREDVSHHRHRHGGQRYTGLHFQMAHGTGRIFFSAGIRFLTKVFGQHVIGSGSCVTADLGGIA